MNSDLIKDVLNAKFGKEIEMPTAKTTWRSYLADTILGTTDDDDVLLIDIIEQINNERINQDADWDTVMTPDMMNHVRKHII